MAPEPKAPDPTGGYRNAPTSAPGGPNQIPLPPTHVDSAGLVAVDLDALKIAVTDFEGLKTQASAPYKASSSYSAGAHPWGQDAMGASFENNYLPSATGAQQALEALVDLFSSLADAMKDTHKDYKDTDDHTTAVVVDLAKVSGR
jgi:uncharacterized protein YukE